MGFVSCYFSKNGRFDSVEQRGRLVAHLIPNKYLNNISSTTIKDALIELKKTAKTDVRKIRSGNPTYENRLAHSFWTQQLVNTTLCLAELGVE